VPPVRTAALILHAFPYGDTSRILRLLTPTFGLRSVIAKGARSPRSRLGAILEPFTEGEAHFFLREGRDLFTLSGFTLLRSRQAIGRDFCAFTGASLLAEVLLRFSTDDPQPEVYHIAVQALDRLANSDIQPTATAVSTLWHLISLFGYQPVMDQCARCGREVPADQPWALDINAGGAVCPRCLPSHRHLPPTLRLEVLRMSSGDSLPSLADSRAHARLLHDFLATHLGHDRPLRSLPLFLASLH
jgi:DNA repair protein RecO (recombination protein O)